MPPREISHYRVVRRLGAGGMGEVSLQQNNQRQHPVAENSRRLEVVNSGIFGRTYVRTQASKKS